MPDSQHKSGLRRTLHGERNDGENPGNHSLHGGGLVVISKPTQVGIVSDHYIVQDVSFIFEETVCANSSAALISGMGRYLRHCVECSRCRTRYLIGFSPYPNGSYLLPVMEGASEEWILYCSCGQPPSSSRCYWSELQLYAVSSPAHARGYGRPEEIVPLERRLRRSG